MIYFSFQVTARKFKYKMDHHNEEAVVIFYEFSATYIEIMNEPEIDSISNNQVDVGGEDMMEFFDQSVDDEFVECLDTIECQEISLQTFHEENPEDVNEEEIPDQLMLEVLLNFENSED